MEMDNDSALLQRYARSRDAEAFAHLVRRHAGMVFAAARRITGCAHDAEDVTQACFLDLARNAGVIRSSLGGWLHAAATHRACNVVRDSATRRSYEKRHAEEKVEGGEAAEVEWEEISPHVDAALAELEEELREPLVLHFLQGRTQAEVAVELGISQPTVSRRLEAGVESLRAKLRNAGVVASVAGVMTCLAQPAEASLPPTLAASLGKIAVAGIGSGGGTATAVSAGSGTMVMGKWFVALAAIVAAVGGVIYYEGKGTIVANPAATTQSNRVVIEGVEELAGWGKEDCTFMGSLAVTLRAMGEKVSYDELMGMSGAAFRLQVASPEWNASSCDAGRGFSCIDAALGAMGYTSRGYDTFDEDVQKKTAARQAICRSIDQRRPVPVISMTFGMDWGVVTGYEGDGKTLLYRTYCRQGKDYVAGQIEPYVAFVLEKKAERPTRRQAMEESLRLAVRLAGMREFVESNGEKKLCGFTAYEAWIAQLLDDAKYERLDAKAIGKMVHPNAWCYQTLMDARSAAGRYLRVAAGEFDGPVADHVQKAAELYQQIADALREGSQSAPFPSQLGERPWTKEHRHAEAQTLKGVLAMEREAFGELEKAVSLLGGTVRREGNRVWIEGVPPLQWGKSGDNTYTGSLQAALVPMGESYSYEQLMVCSGLASRIRWGRDADGRGWNGSALIGELGDVDYPRITGWQLRWITDFSAQNPEHIKQIVASIDAGRPVLGYVRGSEWDMGLVYGYEDGGQRLLVQDYYFKGEGPNVVAATEVHGLIALLDRKTTALDSHAALVEGLQRSIAFWQKGTIDLQEVKPWDQAGRCFLHCGSDAYRQWREDLAAAGNLTKEQLGGLCHHNRWIGCSLGDGRRAASVALAKLAPVLRQEKARMELLAAGDLYSRVSELYARKLVPCLADSTEQFTPEVRETAIGVLRELEQLDAQAMSHIVKAVQIELDEGVAKGIAYIPPLPFGKGRDNQFIAALEATLAARGEAVGYDELMGLSGAAFRVQFWLPEWCPSSVDLLQGYNHAAPVLDALGYRYQLLSTFGRPAEEYREEVVRSLDAGRPVMMENLDGRGRYAVVVGQVNNGEQWVGRCCGDAEGDYTTSTDLPWCVLLLEERGKAMEPTAAFRRSLEIAVELAHTPSYVRDKKPQASGSAAYAAWIKALRDEGSFAKAGQEDLRYMAGANAGMYEVLADARAAGARYLAGHARDLGTKAETHLQEAARLYERIATELAAGRKWVPEREALKGDFAWTPAMRQEEAAILEQVAELEARAVAELEKALQ